MDQKVISLVGKKTEIIIKITNVAEVIYWGSKISNRTDSMVSSVDRAIPYGKLDDDIVMALNPESGRGVFSSPGFEGHRNGKHWSPVMDVKCLTSDKNKLNIYYEDTTITCK